MNNGQTGIEIQPSPTVPLPSSNSAYSVKSCIPARQLKPSLRSVYIYLDAYMLCKSIQRGWNPHLKSLRSRTAARLLSLLVSSQQSVGELERQLRMPQPTVSKHLRVLREAGFVESTVDAQRRLYR